MKKLIDEYIRTIKQGDTYFTYCSLWDDPKNTEREFPNHRVGVGSTKQESLNEFMEHENKRQDLLARIKDTQ